MSKKKSIAPVTDASLEIDKILIKMRELCHDALDQEEKGNDAYWIILGAFNTVYNNDHPSLPVQIYIETAVPDSPNDIQ